jgi:microcystin-dependent protein
MDSSAQLPVGTIVAFLQSSANIPSNWFLCDGKTVIPAQYMELIQALGSDLTPNLCGRTLIGAGAPPYPAPRQSDGSFPNFAPGAEWEVGDTGGEFQHQLVTTEIPAHNHFFDSSQWFGFGLGPSTWITGDDGRWVMCQQGTAGDMSKVIVPTGGDGAHNTMQPYYAVNYIIYGGEPDKIK